MRFLLSNSNLEGSASFVSFQHRRLRPCLSTIADAWCSGAERRLVTILMIMMIMMMMEESGSVECRQQEKEVMEGSARRGTQGRRDTVMLSLRFHGHLDGGLA
jgi:hypothetical protein